MEQKTLESSLIHNYATHVDITEPDLLRKLGNEILEKCEYQILNFMEHFFEPEGYTCIWLLGESHLAIHTFPEKKISYLELSSCSREKNDKFKVVLERAYPCLPV